MKLKKGFTGNRYTAAQKREVVSFVKEYDHKHGRGGVAAAQRRFKVSYIALRTWLVGKAKRKPSVLKPVLERMAGLKGLVKDLDREIRRLRRGF